MGVWNDVTTDCELFADWIQGFADTILGTTSEATLRFRFQTSCRISSLRRVSIAASFSVVIGFFYCCGIGSTAHIPKLELISAYCLRCLTGAVRSFKPLTCILPALSPSLLHLFSFSASFLGASRSKLSTRVVFITRAVPYCTRVGKILADVIETQPSSLSGSLASGVVSFIEAAKDMAQSRATTPVRGTTPARSMTLGADRQRGTTPSGHTKPHGQNHHGASAMKVSSSMANESRPRLLDGSVSLVDATKQYDSPTPSGCPSFATILTSLLCRTHRWGGPTSPRSNRPKSQPRSQSHRAP